MKPKNLAKWGLATGLVILPVKEAAAGLMQWICKGATSADTAKLRIRPDGPNRNLTGFVDDNGNCSVLIPPQIIRESDTLYNETKGTHGRAQWWGLAESLAQNFHGPTLFLRSGLPGFGVNGLNVVDQSGRGGTLYGSLKFDINPSESVYAAVTPGLPGPDWAVDAKLLSSYASGRAFTVRMYKPTITGYNAFATGVIDTTHWDAMYAFRDLYYSPPSGVEVVKGLGKNKAISGTEFYDITGRKLDKAPRNRVYFERQGDNTVRRKLNLR